MNIMMVNGGEDFLMVKVFIKKQMVIIIKVHLKTDWNMDMANKAMEMEIITKVNI